MFRFFAELRARREQARKRVQNDATELLNFMPGMAYREARTRARECRAKKDRAGDAHWGRVAVEIARRTGHVIGEKVADRYAKSAAEAEDGLPRQYARRAVFDALAGIASGIADLTHGRGRETAQTVNARVWQIVELEPAERVRDAARDLRSAIDVLASDPAGNAQALTAGAYPTPAENAGRALERLKAAVMPSASARL